MQKCVLILSLIGMMAGQWSSDPSSPQLLGSGIQAQVKSTSDGGVYIAWLTDMDGYHVYLQKLDPMGIAQFGNTGMLVSDNNNSSWIAVFHMNLDVDSEDNAIITVLDERSGPWNVYAYKISPDGSMLWGNDGITVFTSNDANYSPRLAVFPDNSVVVTWSQNSSIVHFQRISQEGNLMWGDGILIEDNIESLMSPLPIVNIEGNMLIQWIGQSGQIWAADSKIYLQKYNLEGEPQWSEPTVTVGPVVFPMGNWLQKSVLESSGGSFSAWTRMNGNVQSADTQHITQDGDISWIGAVELSINFNNFRMSPCLAIPDNSQELIAVWNESNGSQSQHGIYAQRLDENGNRLWGAYGKTVVALNNNYIYYDLSIESFGEEVITVYIEGNSNNIISDIYASRLDGDGDLIWINGEVPVTNSGNSKSDMMVEKGQGCLFIVWTENNNVFAHCLRDDGILGNPDYLLPGDINGDGEINVIDIIEIVNFILVNEYEINGDINDDGLLNILDIIELIDIILNNI